MFSFIYGRLQQRLRRLLKQPVHRHRLRAHTHTHSSWGSLGSHSCCREWQCLRERPVGTHTHTPARTCTRTHTYTYTHMHAHTHTEVAGKQHKRTCACTFSGSTECVVAAEEPPLLEGGSSEGGASEPRSVCAALLAPEATAGCCCCCCCEGCRCQGRGDAGRALMGLGSRDVGRSRGRSVEWEAAGGAAGRPACSGRVGACCTRQVGACILVCVYVCVHVAQGKLARAFECVCVCVCACEASVSRLRAG